MVPRGRLVRVPRRAGQRHLLGQPVQGGEVRGRPPRRLVGGGEEGGLGHHLAAGAGRQVVEGHALAPHAAQGLPGGGAGQQPLHGLGVGQAADEGHAAVLGQELPQVEGHHLLPAGVHRVGDHALHRGEVGRAVGLVAQPLDGVGVGQPVLVAAVALHVLVHQVHRDAALQAVAQRLDGRVRGLDGQVDRPAAAVGVVHHRQQRQPRHGLEHRAGEGLGQLHGDAVRPRALQRLPRGHGQLQPPVQHGHHGQPPRRRGRLATALAAPGAHGYSSERPAGRR